VTRGKAIAAALAIAASAPVYAQDQAAGKQVNKQEGASPEARAAAIVDAMTLEQQITLLRSKSGASLLDLGVPLPSFIPEPMRAPKPKGAIGTAGFVPAIPEAGLPALHLADASLGVADIGYLRPGDQATALPSSLSLAATFDPGMAR
jgi:beta-glucosidase